jgi:WD40 repeat protein
VRTRVLQGQGVLESLIVHGHTVLAAASNTGEPECSLQLWDARSGECIAHLAAPGSQGVYSMDWRGGATPVLTGGGGGDAALLWDVSAVRRGVTHRAPLALRLGGSTAVCAVALDAASRTAAVGATGTLSVGDGPECGVDPCSFNAGVVFADGATCNSRPNACTGGSVTFYYTQLPRAT